jgi:hypothetical protein
LARTCPTGTFDPAWLNDVLRDFGSDLGGFNDLPDFSMFSGSEAPRSDIDPIGAVGGGSQPDFGMLGGDQLPQYPAPDDVQDYGWYSGGQVPQSDDIYLR